MKLYINKIKFYLMNRPMDDMNCIIAETQDQGAVWLGNIKAACIFG